MSIIVYYFLFTIYLSLYINAPVKLTGGYNYSYKDLEFLGSAVLNIPPLIYRIKNDESVKTNKFIDMVCYEVLLSEKEKQNVYLKYNDVIPWNTAVICEDKGFEDDSHCELTFYINEDNILARRNEDDTYSFFQICPKCGQEVRISDYLIKDTIKERIIKKIFYNLIKIQTYVKTKIVQK